MTTRIGDPPPPHFRIGRSVQRLDKPLITLPSEDEGESPRRGYSFSALSEPSPDSPRGWLLYFAVNDRQRVYILIAE